MPVRLLPRFVWLAVAVHAAAVFGASAASAQGVVPNPEFDVASVTAWTGNTASLSWSQTDPDCLPPDASGSLLVSPDSPTGPVSAFVCVAPPPAGSWVLGFLVRTECEEGVKGMLRFYAAPDCGGTLLGSDQVSGVVPSGSWEQGALFPATIPAGTQSVWIGLELNESITSVCNALFDRIFFGPGTPILRSGFETGSSACRWSATVP